MEELFLTGYCRALDQSRTVCAEITAEKLEYVDCDYPACPYAPTCPIATQLPKTL
jgi:hypothetical protein